MMICDCGHDEDTHDVYLGASNSRLVAECSECDCNDFFEDEEDAEDDLGSYA